MDFFERQSHMFSDEEMENIRSMEVVVAGAGGLGTHQIQELQRIGVKKIYVYDNDTVAASNLNRQVFYGRSDIGKDKVYRTEEYINSFQLETEIIPCRERITEDTELPENIDLVYDAFDNFSGRYVLNNLAEERGLPFVHGGVSSWYGQVTTIVPGQTPHLRDIFGDTAAPEGTIPVFSPVVALVASLQVIEGVKVYLGREDTLAGKILYIDTDTYSFEVINL